MQWWGVGLLVCAGCTGDLVELSSPEAVRAVDMARLPAPSPSPTADSGEPPAPGDGGAATAPADLAPPPVSTRFADVQTDVDALGCSAASCHGGSQTPVLKSMAATAAALSANFAAFKLFAATGAQSLVLTKNLSGSGVDHTGGKSFASTNDVVYQRWLHWIDAGAPQ